MNHTLIKLTFLGFLLLAFTSTTFANLSIHHSPTPGGIAIVPIPSFNSTAPIVTYKGNRVLTIKNTDRLQQTAAWVAVVGIPLSVTPGTQTIKLHTLNGGAQNITFQVKSKSYKIERINFNGYRPGKKTSNKPYVITELDRRILRELKEIETTYKHWLDTNEIAKIHLKLPIQGRKSSAFGLKRILNGIPKSPHSGLDIAAPEGTPVRAPKDGIVIKTSNFFLTGNAVFIEHGQGFITSYFHLKKIAVKLGEKVTQSDIIGFVGKTGRATGSHLHWSVSLNGVRVNPELLLPNGSSSVSAANLTNRKTKAIY